jgi:hypothetical protein
MQLPTGRRLEGSATMLVSVAPPGFSGGGTEPVLSKAEGCPQ